MMRIVVITPPHAVHREAATIRLLLDAGIDRVHIRKPEASREELCALLEAIPERLRPRLSLHDGHCLAIQYGIGGVHLNARNPLPPEGFRGVVSRSCHSLDELAADTACSYRFLSPIFDSISKNGYRAAFTAEELRTAAARGLLGDRTLALGGITPDRLAAVRDYGFGGAALLGSIWQQPSPESLHRTIDKIIAFKNL